MADDPHGKLLWDVVAGELAGQAADQSSLTGRAKDLLGVATISTTITGVILNDTLFSFDKEKDIPLWWILLAAAALLAIFVPGLLALVPRTYSFVPDSAGFFRIEQDFPAVSDGALYRSMAEGFLLDDAEGKTTLERNRTVITFINRMVNIQMCGVAALTAAAFILAFLIGR